MTARGYDRKLIHWIASHGYTVVRAGSGHWKIYDNGVLLERPLHVFLHPLGSPLCRYERGSMGQVVRNG